MKPRSSATTLLIMLLLLALSSCRNEKVITFRSLLKEMADPEALTRYPDPPYRLVQHSSYDRRSIHPDSAGWFANDDFTQFIREETNNGRREFVMFEAEGPGAVVRWWMTFGNINALESYIRVYIDGDPSPVLEGRAPDLTGGEMIVPWPLSASVSPASDPQVRGYNLYMPIPFSESCKVTLENDSVIITPVRRSPSIYYSVSARLYEEGARVVSFRNEMLKSDSLAVAECSAALNTLKSDMNKRAKRNSSSGTFLPGTSCNISLREKGTAISSIRMSLGALDTSAALKNTMIKISFDGKETVNVPAGSFFGTGYTINPYRTYFSGTDADGTMRITRLMPFNESCVISIFNGTDDTLNIDAEVTSVPYKWDRSSMYFGTSWHEYAGIETAGSERTGGTGLHFDISFTELKGKGVYAGDAVVVINTADAWWGEGDEKIYVDGETFPSSFGTGTEDYFGYAWCRPDPFSHPFIAQPTGAGNFHPGMSVNMRYRNLDAIPFTKSVKADIELWHWVKTTIDYGLTSYYYMMPGCLTTE